MIKRKTHWSYKISHGSGGWYWTTYLRNREADYVGPYKTKAEALADAEGWMESKRKAWEGA